MLLTFNQKWGDCSIFDFYLFYDLFLHVFDIIPHLDQFLHT